MSNLSASQMIISIQHGIKGLATCFGATGNPFLADTLLDFYDQLEKAKDKIEEDRREKNELYLNQAKYGKIILEATLAGIKIGMEEAKRPVVNNVVMTSGDESE